MWIICVWIAIVTKFLIGCAGLRKMLTVHGGAMRLSRINRMMAGMRMRLGGVRIWENRHQIPSG